MKLYGYLKGSGKLGNIVCSQMGGETIARDYQPTVANPNTEEQVSQRSRFKLMSQVAASMASVIAIPKKGLQSSRNLFVKRNFPIAFVSGNNAGIALENIQLTAGNAGFAPVVASRESVESPITVKLASSVAGAVSRVVYNAFAISSEGNLQLVGSTVVDAPGTDGSFATTLPANGSDTVIYAYGLKDMNAKATAKYGNYNVRNGEDVAALILSRKLSSSDMQVTETTGNILGATDTETVDVPDGSVKIEVFGYGTGKIKETSGTTLAKKLTLVKTIGSSVSLTFVPESNFVFKDWVDEATRNVLSADNPYVFTADRNMSILAIANYHEGGIE